MKRWIGIMFFGVVLALSIGCQFKGEETTVSSEQPLSQEEADVADSIDDLDDLEEMDKELEEDISFDELENLDLG